MLKARNFIRNSEELGSRHCHDPSTSPEQISLESSGQISRPPGPPPKPPGHTSMSPGETGRPSETTQQSPKGKLAQPKESVDDHDYVLPATTFSHQRCRTLLASGGHIPSTRADMAGRLWVGRQSQLRERSPQQEFAEVTRSLLESDVDPSHLVEFEMSSGPPGPFSDQRPTLRGGQGDIYRLKQLHSPSRAQGICRNDSLASKSSPPKGDSGVARIGPSETEASLAEHYRLALAVSRHLAQDASVGMDDDHDGLENSPSAENQGGQFDSLGPISRTHTNENPEPSRRRRAINREARLIDGAIFNPRARKRLSSQNSVPPTGEVANVEGNGAPTATARRSWTPVRQRLDSRHSWFQNIRTIFRQGERSTLSLKSRKPGPSTNTNLGPAASFNQRKGKNTASTHEDNRRLASLGLDGTFDKKLSFSKYPLDLNKALPLSPGEILHFKSSGSKLQPHLHSHANLKSTIATLTQTIRASLGKRNLLKTSIPSRTVVPPPVRFKPDRKAASSAGSSDPKKHPQPDSS